MLPAEHLVINVGGQLFQLGIKTAMRIGLLREYLTGFKDDRMFLATSRSVHCDFCTGNKISGGSTDEELSRPPILPGILRAVPVFDRCPRIFGKILQAARAGIYYVVKVGSNDDYEAEIWRYPWTVSGVEGHVTIVSSVNGEVAKVGKNAFPMTFGGSEINLADKRRPDQIYVMVMSKIYLRSKIAAAPRIVFNNEVIVRFSRGDAVIPIKAAMLIVTFRKILCPEADKGILFSGDVTLEYLDSFTPSKENVEKLQKIMITNGYIDETEVVLEAAIRRVTVRVDYSKGSQAYVCKLLGYPYTI